MILIEIIIEATLTKRAYVPLSANLYDSQVSQSMEMMLNLNLKKLKLMLCERREGIIHVKSSIKGIFLRCPT
jgi:hypothetical protein